MKTTELGLKDLFVRTSRLLSVVTLKEMDLNHDLARVMERETTAGPEQPATGCTREDRVCYAMPSHKEAL